MGQRMWDIVVVFLFHEIYPISFINKFNFVNYIIQNSPHVIQCTRMSLELFKV